ncbi:MAG: trypsin-like peptidase domain-containing protein [Nitrososphaerota archaeon]|nr:trypsin-like peptidase domain-containing protein [Nitrososphaerota archaeon]
MRLDLSTNREDRAYTGVIIPAVVIIAMIVIIGVLGSLVVVGNLDGASTVTATKVVPTTVTTSVQRSSNLSLDSSTNSTAVSLNAEQIYVATNRSIVTLAGDQLQNTIFGQAYVSILGSGFVIQYAGNYYIVTNYHVAGATSNLTVTFSNGDSYPAKVVGSDPYSDLAIVSSSQAPSSEYVPLTLTSSSSLQVGETIVAIGNPYGLTGSMTEGIISQLGRTIQDPTAGNFSIANVIQFSAPINPGNSGGPLLNSEGDVVGITTATVSSSQGVGFAIPSDTIIKELPSLIANGSYTKHSYLGIEEVDMNYQLAQAMGANVTYGVLIESTVPNGPAANAEIRGSTTPVTIEGQQYFIGGDIIVSINGTRIINGDALASYLEEHTVAGQTITLGIIRDGNQYILLNLTLGARPPI